MAVPREPPSVIQAESPPGEVAAVPPPARQSQHSVPTGSWWLLLRGTRTGQERSIQGTATEVPRAHTEPARSRDRAVWQPAAPKQGLSGAGGEFALSTHAARLTAGSLPVLGLWVALGQAGPQPSSSALALLVLSSRGDWCPFPGRTVAHVAPRVSSHPGDDPDSKAFPSPAGAGSGPAPSQEVPESVPGPSLARPRQHRGCTRAWGRALHPGKRSPRGVTPRLAPRGPSLLLRAPEAQCGNAPGMLLGEGGERQQPAPVGSWLAAGFAASRLHPGAVVIAQGTAVPQRTGKYLQAAARWSARTCSGTEAEG